MVNKKFLLNTWNAQYSMCSTFYDQFSSITRPPDIQLPPPSFFLSRTHCAIHSAKSTVSMDMMSSLTHLEQLQSQDSRQRHAVDIHCWLTPSPFHATFLLHRFLSEIECATQLSFLDISTNFSNDLIKIRYHLIVRMIRKPTCELSKYSPNTLPSDDIIIIMLSYKLTRDIKRSVTITFNDQIRFAEWIGRIYSDFYH